MLTVYLCGGINSLSVSPQELVAEERRQLAVMLRYPVHYAYCESCDADTEHLEPVYEGEDGECLPCAKSRIASMAEAANDVRGMAAYLARWKRQ